MSVTRNVDSIYAIYTIKVKSGGVSAVFEVKNPAGGTVWRMYWHCCIFGRFDIYILFILLGIKFYYILTHGNGYAGAGGNFLCRGKAQSIYIPIFL